MSEPEAPKPGEGCAHAPKSTPTLVCDWCTAYFAAGDLFCPKCAIRHPHGEASSWIACICGHRFEPNQLMRESSGNASYKSAVALLGGMINAGSTNGRAQFDFALAFVSQLFRLPLEKVSVDADAFADQNPQPGGRRTILTLDRGGRP